jgi:hypothetical protein
MPTARPTPDELHIIESYQRILNDVARCAQAVRDGEWHHLVDTAEDLSRHAVHLAVAAGQLGDPNTRPRADVVVETVVAGNGSQVVRALHPLRPSVVAKTAMTDPFTHPGA